MTSRQVPLATMAGEDAGQAALWGDDPHHEQHAVLRAEAREVDAALVQQLAARALHERQVLGVIDDAPGVGVLVVDPNGNLQESDSRSLVAAGATMPKCR